MREDAKSGAGEARQDGDKIVKPGGKVIIPNVLWYAHALKVPKDRRRSRAPQETLTEALERVGRLKVIEHGWNVVPFEIEMFLHLPKACVAAWWYDPHTGAVEYTKNKTPSSWGSGWRHFVDGQSKQRPEIATIWKKRIAGQWIPGFMLRYPAKDAIRPGSPQELSWQAWKREERLRARKSYVAVYTQFFEQHHPLSGQMLKNLVENVLGACALPVDDAVDYYGNSLVRTR